MKSKIRMQMVKSIAIDFDGVLHSFNGGWQGVRTISGPPVDGAIPWLKKLISVCNVQIYSGRSARFGGKKAMKKWLLKWGLSRKEISQLSFPLLKPIAVILVDDRCFCFNGTFPDTEYLLNFKPWHNQPIWRKTGLDS